MRSTDGYCTEGGKRVSRVRPSNVQLLSRLLSTSQNMPETPRRRKQAPRKTQKPTKNENLTDGKVKELMKERLKLDFEPEDWQCALVKNILQGKDAMFLAGTGYGKSLVYEGLVALEPKKMVINVCPLKALERDQVSLSTRSDASPY